MDTLEHYLRVNEGKDIIDHSLRVQKRGDFITFYIHADGKDSDTPAFVVFGNEVREVPSFKTCQHPQEYHYKFPVTNAVTQNSIMVRYCLCGTNLEPRLKP